MNPKLDPKTDHLLHEVAEAWCEATAGSEARFLEEFRARLAREREKPATAARVESMAVRPRSDGRSRLAWPLGIAAAVVVAVGAIALYLSIRSELGQIEYQRGSLTVADSEDLRKGTRLVSDEKGAGIVSLDDDRIRLFLHVDTALEVVEVDAVRLDRGAIWVVVEPGSGPFEVQTPEGSVTVQGTTFGVVVAEGTTEVTLASGRVVAATARASVTLAAGRRAVLTHDADTIPTETIQAQVPDWVRALEAEAARSKAAKFFPSGSPRSEPHGGMESCLPGEQASL